jgi:hypothetical protein
MNFNQNISNANYTFQSSSFFLPLTVQTHHDSVSNSATTTSQWSPFSTPSFSPYQSNNASASSKNFFQYSSFASPTTNRQSTTMSPFSFNNFNPNRTTLNVRQTANTNSCIAANFGNKETRANHNQLHNIQRVKQPKRSDEVDMSSYIKHAAIQRSLGARYLNLKILIIISI